MEVHAGKNMYAKNLLKEAAAALSVQKHGDGSRKMNKLRCVRQPVQLEGPGQSLDHSRLRGCQ